MVFSQQITQTFYSCEHFSFIEAANNKSQVVSSVCFMFKPRFVLELLP